MSYKPAKVEVIAKAFIYLILAMAGVLGSLGIAVFMWGGRHTKGEGQRIVAEHMFQIMSTPYFAAFIIVVGFIAVYSAINGLPKWVRLIGITFVAVALAPVTIRVLIDRLVLKLRG